MKMLYVLEKKLDKSPKRSQNPVGLQQLTALPPDAQVVTFFTCFNYFKITAFVSYLSDG